MRTQEEAAKLKAGAAAPPTAEAASSSENGKGKGEGEGEEEEGKGAVPIHNGGICDKYRWTQTLQDLQVTVPVPKGTKAKMMNIVIAKKKILVQVRRSSWKRRRPCRRSAPRPPRLDHPRP